VNLLVFVLAFFLDFFELSFIVIPLLAPVAAKLGIDLVWFGVLLAVNMQTSFMHPPFGFALFYLRSVAPASDYVDKLTGRKIARVTIEQIYWGAVPFVLIQLFMVALIIAFPGIVSTGLAQGELIDADKALQEMRNQEPQEGEPDPWASDPQAPAEGASAAEPGASAGGEPAQEVDPMKAMEEALEREKAPK
jgi:Tripartite ATP-independent periplasmic transporter, DctM component